MNERWTNSLHLLMQLEDCADNGGFMTLNQQQAQILRDQIHLLRAGRNIQVNTTDRPGATIPPPEPDRDGQQFEDRDGSVWTWTPWTHMASIEDRNAFGGHNVLIREADDGDDEICSWPQAWIEHGPLWPLPQVRAAGQVVLRSQLVVNGRRYQVQAAADEFYWEHYGSDFHKHMKADVRRRLVAGLVEELGPQVSVQRRPKWIREQEARFRERYMPPGTAAAPTEGS
jgi:hypothetical protein